MSRMWNESILREFVGSIEFETPDDSRHDSNDTADSTLALICDTPKGTVLEYSAT